MNTTISTNLKIGASYLPIDIEVNFSERSINVVCLDFDQTITKDTEWEEQQMDNEEFVLEYILARLGEDITNEMKRYYND
jgi:hypothetical protein